MTGADAQVACDQPPALELDGISAGYEGATVCTDLSLTVPAGSVTALLGANGAGKTTTLRVAAGLLRPTRGVVRVYGADVTRLPAHQRARAGVCLIPEGRGIFRSLTVAENLRLQGPPRASADGLHRVIEVFPALGRHLGREAGSLSGGEQQMLALARAYLANPALVLVDEASCGLSPLMVDQVFATLRDIAAAGVALLIVEQYVHRALEVAQQVVVLDRGRVLFRGQPSELGRDVLLRSYLGAESDPGPSIDSKG
jgi:branched-chain amino acid transport system ATP-binding protein